jgi:ATP-dependent DNA helicase RecQ
MEAGMNNEITDLLSCAVKSLFGIPYLFPYQRLVITNILEAAQAAGIQVNWPRRKGEKNTVIQSNEIAAQEPSDRECLGRQIVILPTGAGKSLCFQLPAMLIDGLTLVIYPLLSLMADQNRRLSERGFSPVIIRGGQSRKERDEIWGKLKSGQSKFIIANPEVLLTYQVKAQLEKINVTHVVIDEAHCVSEWGESFRPSYLETGSIIDFLKPPLVTAFTATASLAVLEKIRKRIFGNLGARQITGNPDRPNISYSVQGCINRNLAVRDLLIKNARPAIVFCTSRPGTEKLAHYLRNELAEIGCDWYREIRFYHAGLSGEERAETEKWFINNPKAVLSATCAYGMGVDKADVRTVIHRDCAPSIEAYLQESGRAGRDGGQSNAILLRGPEDEIALTRIKTEDARVRIMQVLRYSEDTGHCRRHSLLALLDYDADGEVPGKNCCDVCEKKADAALREESSIMDFFRRNKRRFTDNEAASVLAASETIRWSEEEAGQVIGYLIKTGKLKRTGRFLWKNRITVQ